MASLPLPLLTILGPTASGKTALAAKVAHHIGGEIISADSRQVYRGMDIGTGKDMDDYIVNGRRIPLHLTDIAEPGTEYNLFQYQHDFLRAFREILSHERIPILCGGSGMYLDAVLTSYRLTEADSNPEQKKDLESRTVEELLTLLRDLRPLHNTTDLLDRNRMIRAIEIGLSEKRGETAPSVIPPFTPMIFGIHWERNALCDRIEQRLTDRILGGMIEEVEGLLRRGISPERLKFYGLEYRYTMMYLEKKLSLTEYTGRLNIAIRQFAKRQMTWFRRMERNGTKIQWVDGTLPEPEKIGIILNRFRNFTF